MAFLKVFTLGWALAVTVACNSLPTGSPGSHVSISSVDWNIENSDKGYWSLGAEPSSLVYSFWISYQGTLNLADVKEIRMLLPGSPDQGWTLYPSDGGPADRFVHADESTVGGFGHWWLRVGDQAYKQTLPLGTLTALIAYKDGTLVTKTWTATEPNSLAPPQHSYVSNEEAAKTPDGTTPIKALKRPTIASAALSPSNLKVVLNLGDPRIFNGYLYFYNAAGTYLGRTKAFRDKATGDLTSIFGGQALKPTGSNTLNVTASDLVPENGNPVPNFLSQISKVTAMVTDGNQYVATATNRYSQYNYSAVGAKVSVTSSK